MAFTMTPEAWAGWVTGVGTIFLGVVAIVVPWIQRMKDLNDRKKEAADRENDRAVEAWEAERARMMTDLDETRRLLLMGIHYPEAFHDPTLFGSLINAIAYHSWLASPQYAADLLARYRDDGSSLDTGSDGDSDHSQARPTLTATTARGAT
jgi:hypothetical protein